MSTVEVDAPQTRRETLQEVFVVDTDVHAHEQPAEIADYIEKPWDMALRQIANIPERYLDLPGISPNALFGVFFPGGGGRTQLVTSARQMRDELDKLHVDVAVVFPDHLLLLPKLQSPVFASALTSAYNDWLYDRWLREDTSLRGALVACPQDPQGTAEYIRRHGGKPEWCCIYLPCCSVRPLWGHRSYDPIYEAATEVGLPLAMHSVTTVHPTFPFNLEVFEATASQHVVAHTWSMMANLMSLLETAAFLRFPELRFCVMEAGVSWMPYLMLKLDKEYLEQRRTYPFLQERPSHYLKQVYVGTQPIEEPERRKDIVTLIELFEGSERVIFASDWPHHDFDHPQHVFGLPFDSETRRKIMGLNAARFFRGIEVPEGPYA